MRALFRYIFMLEWVQRVLFWLLCDPLENGAFEVEKMARNDEE
jgi:hypothetical protein